jgi:hypothetical protein
MKRASLAHGIAVAGVLFAGVALADEPAGKPGAAGAPPAETSVERGYRFITEKPYIPAGLDEATFERLWTVWAEPARACAEKATPLERRRMAFERYGLTPRPSAPGAPGDVSGKPLQYVVDASGDWSISCFACHSGQVAGTTIPGLPNAHLALQTLVDDVATLSAAERRAPDLAAILLKSVPFGETHGTTNAVMFSVALLAFRDKDLNLTLPKTPPKFVHHDLDAPPWWHVHRKKRLYLDGLVEVGHRSLMQFLLVPVNGPARLKTWEPDFKDILAYIQSVRPPTWPYPVDRALAARGKRVFETSCSACHGTYGDCSTYPELAVPIEVVGTDRVRYDAIAREERVKFSDSWFTEYQPSKARIDLEGYVAPPLDGIWASAPYFHNGSVPTLDGVLHPDARPKAWRVKSATGYDACRVGLDVEERDAPPPGIADPWERRSWFDTARPGKSAAGHRFPLEVPEADRPALLEYLKTL